ncbi:MAG: tetratricopeptide repeat protein [Elusimicrobiota bacterium]
MMTRLLPALCGVLVLSAAAGASPVVEAEFATIDWAALPAAAATPQSTLAVTPEVLASIDHAYLNRHQGQNLQESNASLRALITQNPSNPDIAWRLARGLNAWGVRQSTRDEKLHVFAEGETILNTALSNNPNSALNHYWLARIYGAQNEIKRTLGLAKAMRRELETAIQLDPKLAGAHHIYGELLRQLPWIVGGDKQKAVAEIEQAVRLTPNDSALYPALAEAYLAVKDKARAIETARKTFTVTPDDPGGYDGDVKDAREFLKKLGAN